MTSRKGNRGGSFHASRVSGHQKFLRAKKANEEIEKSKKKFKLKPLDLKKNDWSLTNTQPRAGM